MMKSTPQIHDLKSILANGEFLPMHASDGEGIDLIQMGKLGAGIVRFGSGSGVDDHTHIGAHILYVLEGEGTLTYRGENHPLKQGFIYGIPSEVLHAIWAIRDLTLLVIGDNYQPADATNRLEGGGSLKHTFTS